MQKEVIESYRKLIAEHAGEDTPAIAHARAMVAKADAKPKTFNVCVALTVEINERVRATSATSAAQIAMDRASVKIANAEKRTAIENPTLIDAHVTDDDGTKIKDDHIEK